MPNQIEIHPGRPADREAIVGLLQSSALPVEDLPLELPHFFTATDNDLVVGVIGLEIYERNGLLRSLAVNPAYRNNKIAGSLIEELEKQAAGLGLNTVYLLTETARDYFAKKGYEATARKDAPASLKRSTEFIHVCP